MQSRGTMGFKRLQAAIYFQLDNFRRRPGYFAVLVVLCLLYVLYWLAMRGSSSQGTIANQSMTSNNKTVLPVSHGLQMAGTQLKLNAKPFTILSGAIHYFRVMPEYWEDSLKKLKAMGLNTVETYVAWNLHEEIKGNFKFRDDIDIVKFVKTAKSLGLYVIIRPGPFICAEWDLGGLPSWLLNDPYQKLRTSYGPFLQAVEKYFDELFPLLTPLQYTMGGPIIAWQIENEYLSLRKDIDKQYVQALHQLMIKQGVTELLITSDNIYSLKDHSLGMKGVLQTVNFQKDPKLVLNSLKEIQPDKPLMVTEFWPGWFDYWGGKHHVMHKKNVTKRVAEILDMGASINFYMFHGGTNFGFMNGANTDSPGGYLPDVTSYDYDAPLSEAGDITPKYKALRATIRKHAPSHSLPDPFPEIPPNLHKAAYDSIKVDGYVPLNKMYKYDDQTISNSRRIMPMEYLPMYNNGGQGYGFIVYQTKLAHDAKTVVIEEYRDRAKVLVNSKVLSTLCAYDPKTRIFDVKKMARNEIQLQFEKPSDIDDDVVLEILVENLGRVNFGKTMDTQRKGILGRVLVDGVPPRKWKIHPLDFNRLFTEQAFLNVIWSKVPKHTSKASHTPGFYTATFYIQDQPRNTFVNLQGWGKGVCFVNRRNLGRYWKIGPQQTLYLPASWLQNGENTIVLFELDEARKDGLIEFSDEPVLGSDVMEQP